MKVRVGLFGVFTLCDLASALSTKLETLVPTKGDPSGQQDAKEKRKKRKG